MKISFSLIQPLTWVQSKYGFVVFTFVVAFLIFFYYRQDKPVETSIRKINEIHDAASRNSETLKRIDRVCAGTSQIQVAKVFGKANLTSNGWKARKRWLRRMRVNEKHEVIYYSIAKVASRTILRYLVKLSQPQLSDTVVDKMTVYNTMTDVAKKHTTQMTAVPSAKRWNYFENFKIFTFVRNPLDRIVSAWNDKLLSTDSSIKKRYAPDIFRLADSRNDRNVTLTDFFHYLVAFPKSSEYFNEHWQPMYHSCLPCAVKYDFVGRIENIEADMDYVTRHVMHGVKTTARLPSPTPFKNKYEQVKKLPRQLVERVLEIYRLDYDIFGYNMTADLEAIYGSSSS